ncbi:hypothetical protein E1264_42555 [Actinomadura sp. KC216]|uniref:hypothetical protein n=1 Tax=Actinomadura sp. KC216 TaxID=2530370 RepID=UPI00104E95C3|nr:hypothetical protein [Actinomadura sp. KC216]TDB71213.1 hypothetical protein E1264_42555 [Actinomadura sp. KC216]
MAAQTPPRVPDGITHWYGDSTGSWWAIVPGRDGARLVEADTRERLAEKVGWDLRRSASAQNRDDPQARPERAVRPAPVSAPWPSPDPGPAAPSRSALAPPSAARRPYPLRDPSCCSPR